MTRAVKNHYIDYIEGGLPIILSAPHGGSENPSYIRNRTTGVFEKDENTYELTKDIVAEFKRQTKRTPYTVLATISRIKVDINREVKEAYEDEKASIPYNQFHFLIKSARRKVEESFGKGIFFDIHGQSHPAACLEFGYLLDNKILKLNETKLKEYKNHSSIKTLSRFSKESFIEQLKGNNSMGSLMTRLGFDSIPSNKLPFAKDDNYFEGAYHTFKYGSLDGGNINAIQVEFPFIKCRDTEENRKKCAKAFVSSVIKFFEIHLDLDLKSIN